MLHVLVIIGAADGPTSILVSQKLGTNYLGAITVAALLLYGSCALSTTFSN